jgi:hypothetical protein
MSSTYSNLKFELIASGEQSGTWGATTNTNVGTAIEQAIVGMATLTSADFTANVATLTLTNTNAAQNARALCLNIAAGAVSAAGTINVPAIQKPYVIINGSSYTVTVKVSGLTGVAVPAGKRLVVYNNGTDVSVQTDYLPSLTLGTALPIASGGTGSTSTAYVDLTTNVTGALPIANGGSAATTAAAARTNFGATTLGSNIFTISNPSAVTFPQFNADNTVSSLSAAAFRAAIGAGSGGGSVTSVGGTGTVNGITLSGTVTSSGNLTLGGTLSGVSLTTQVSGTLPIANGGTGQTSLTGLALAQPVITQNVQVIGTGVTAVASRTYVMTADMTLTLPASPASGDWVNVINMSGTTTPIVGRNGSNIMSSATDLTIDLNNTGVTLIYADATRGWVLLP